MFGPHSSSPRKQPCFDPSTLNLYLLDFITKLLPHSWNSHKQRGFDLLVGDSIFIHSIEKRRSSNANLFQASDEVVANVFGTGEVDGTTQPHHEVNVQHLSGHMREWQVGQHSLRGCCRRSCSDIMLAYKVFKEYLEFACPC